MASNPKKKIPARATSSRRSTAKSPETSNLWQRHRHDLTTLIFFVVGAVVLLAECNALGPTGHVVSKFLGVCVGWSRWAIPVVTTSVAVLLFRGQMDLDRRRVTVGIVLSVVGLSGLCHFVGTEPGYHATSASLTHAGGYLGVAVGGGLRSAVGSVGTIIILLAVVVVAVMVLTGLSLRVLVVSTWSSLRRAVEAVVHWWNSRPEPVIREKAPTPVVEEPPVADYEEEEWDDDEPAADDVLVSDENPTTFAEPEFETPETTVGEEEPPAYVPRRRRAKKDVAVWSLPPLSLLQRVKERKLDRSAIDAAGAELVAALGAHGVDTTLVGYTVGPTVTRFELELGPGVKVARVTSLNKDIAYAMASPDVRILAPIPGRSAIGVEVPNRQRVLVSLGDLLASEEAVVANHPLDVPLGRDISGATVVVNLAEMPHVLISGATGAGKSSCINSLITSLVMRATPEQLRLILVDPKRVELGQYNDLKHLLFPVVVDPKKASAVLQYAVKEMERRYNILAEAGVRDLTSYHLMIERGELIPPPTLDDGSETPEGTEEMSVSQPYERFPYIVIIVDELNDLMMVAAREVEESVVRIAQMARAVGIHLVLATQRPSVDVITGVIKANIPSRMAFAVSSLADSRVILDQAGAERLIGKGDMLILTASSNVARRLQSPWVSEEEVRNVVDHWKNQDGHVARVELLTGKANSGDGLSSFGDDDDDEELLSQAREIVIATQSGSTSMLQRKLRIGFARAGRLMDLLENEGTVAPGDGSKARKVLTQPSSDSSDPQ